MESGEFHAHGMGELPRKFQFFSGKTRQLEIHETGSYKMAKARPLTKPRRKFPVTSFSLSKLTTKKYTFQCCCWTKKLSFGISCQTNGIMHRKSGVLVLVLGCDEWKTNQSALKTRYRNVVTIVQQDAGNIRTLVRPLKVK